MTTVAGLDLSLTNAGCAVITTDGTDYSVESWVKLSKGRRGDTLRDRWDRLCSIRMDVVGYVADAELVVVEGPAYGASGASQHDRAGSWWQVVGRLLSSDVPVVVAAPATVKKFAAGSGRADKAAVAMSMARTWPQWDPLLAARAEDMADAVACASLGLALLGLQPFPMQKWRQEPLAKVQLPDEMEAA